MPDSQSCFLHADRYKIGIVKSDIVEKEKKVIFFDGVCNLCNGFINYVIKHDKSAEIFFAPLQSRYAKNNLGHEYTDIQSLKTVVFSDKGTIYTKSTAVLKVIKQLPGIHPYIAFLGLAVNRRLRDFIYDWLARNRYKVWGRRDSCRLPTHAEKARFLE